MYEGVGKRVNRLNCELTEFPLLQCLTAILHIAEVESLSGTTLPSRAPVSCRWK